MTRSRNTKQRACVLEAVRGTRNHPTAEEVYDTVRQALPRVSLATVYRNLNQLAQEGTLRRILLPNAPDRYDRTTAGHYHITCIRCGAFEDLRAVPYNGRYDGAAAAEGGYTVLGHDTVFRGVCPACKAHYQNHDIKGEKEHGTERIED